MQAPPAQTRPHRARRALWLLCALFTGFAQAEPPPHFDFPTKGLCRPESQAVVFVNGVDKPDPGLVRIDATELATKLARDGIHTGEVQYFYNPSFHVLGDLLLEAAGQWVSTQSAAGANVVIATAEKYLKLGLAFFGVATPSPDEVTLLDNVQARIAVSLDASFTSPFFVQEHVEAWLPSLQTTLDASNKIVLVAHSQGNFFANALRNRVYGASPGWVAKGLTIVNVANMLPSAPDGLELSNACDKVVRWVPLNSRPNFTANQPCDRIYAEVDYWGHGFSEVYMNDALRSDELGVSSFEQLGRLVRTALQPPEGVPLCCSSRHLPAATPSFALSYRLWASDGASATITGTKTFPVSATVTSDIYGPPRFEAVGWVDEGRTQFIGRTASPIENRDAVLSFQEAQVYLRFEEPAQQPGGVFETGFNPGIASFESMRPVCVRYGEGISGHRDRTDVTDGWVHWQVTGALQQTVDSRSRANCANPSCLSNMPTYDGHFLELEFTGMPMVQNIAREPSF